MRRGRVATGVYGRGPITPHAQQQQTEKAAHHSTPVVNVTVVDAAIALPEKSVTPPAMISSTYSVLGSSGQRGVHVGDGFLGADDGGNARRIGVHPCPV